MCERKGHSLLNEYGRKRVFCLKGGIGRVLKNVWRDLWDGILKRCPTTRATDLLCKPLTPLLGAHFRKATHSKTKIPRVLLLITSFAVLLSACLPATLAFTPTPTAFLSPLPSPLPPTSTPGLAIPTPLPQIQAIEHFQRQLNIPSSSLTFMETSKMINSPSGTLLVDVYRDSQDRQYAVDPVTNRVVEMDARSLIPSFSLTPTAPDFSMEELRSIAEQFVRATTDDFLTLKSELTYEEGAKGDLYFFTWRAKPDPSLMNPPFAQIGFYKNGEVIAYYNTLGLK